MTETQSENKVVKTEPEVFCPKCGQLVVRIHKNSIDKVLNRLFEVRRYKCYGCFWEGRKIYFSK